MPSLGENYAHVTRAVKKEQVASRSDWTLRPQDGTFYVTGVIFRGLRENDGFVLTRFTRLRLASLLHALLVLMAGTMNIWPLDISIAAFLLSALVIGVAGTSLSRRADRLAEITGLGEAVMGAVFLGAATSISGITASVLAAAEGHASLAVSNAIGGIAVQTVFLAVADFAYRGVNLEHAAASLPNMMFGSLLILLLALILFAMLGPDYALLGVHPVTPVLFISYIYGVRVIHHSYKQPMWRPRMTSATQVEKRGRKKAAGGEQKRLWFFFILSMAAVVASGWVILRAATSLTYHTGLSPTLVGGLFVAAATSLPELVTSVAAVRSGAPTLAVGGILGGNAFDTLFAAASDVAYREGSVFHAVSSRDALFTVVAIIMSAILLLGLLRREKSGIANIGLESFLVIVVYVVAVIIIAGY